MKKNISLIMALLIIASSIMVSCSDSSDDSLGNDSSAQSQSENNGTEQTTQIETEEEIPELPEKKFDGRTFTIFQCTHLASEHYAPEENGDVLNDAIYNRNLSIEEKYDIKFNYLDTAYGSYANEVRSSVLADDKLYDMLSGHAVFSAQLIPENIYMNLKDVPYLNEGLEYPWWNQNVVNDLSINNKIMMIAGDIGYFNIGHVEAILFNKKLFDDAGIEYPYQMVLDHTWTYDNYEKIIKDKNTDIDGNGKIVGGQDLFGFSSMKLFADVMFFYNFGGSCISKDENDMPVLDFMNDENVKRIETGYKWMVENEPYMPDYPGHDDYSIEASHVAFKNDLAYTFCTMLKNLSVLRDMESDYGVVPFPLLDESQENYVSQIDGGTSMVMLPNTCDPEFSGLIVEAMARASTDTIVPAFYEATLLGKYSRDEMSVKMFEILRNTTHYDIGYIFSLGTGYIARDIIYKDGNLASYYAKNEKLLTKSLEKFAEKFTEQN